MIRWHARVHQQRDQPCPSHITRKGITPEHAGALGPAPGHWPSCDRAARCPDLPNRERYQFAYLCNTQHDHSQLDQREYLAAMSYIEPFSSSDFADLEDVDGLGECLCDRLTWNLDHSTQGRVGESQLAGGKHPRVQKRPYFFYTQAGLGCVSRYR